MARKRKKPPGAKRGGEVSGGRSLSWKIYDECRDEVVTSGWRGGRNIDALLEWVDGYVTGRYGNGARWDWWRSPDGEVVEVYVHPDE